MNALSLSTRSPSTQPSRPIDKSIMQATWMIQLGWTNYLESLGTGMLVETLMQLATLLLYSSMNIPVCPSDVEYLKLGLHALNQESGLCFINSNSFLNLHHASLHPAVVAGSAKSKFCDICINTMQMYHWPLVMTLTFMTCFLQRKADGATQGFELFKIEGHLSQIEAAVFVALLCPPHLKDAVITCPTDQALLLLALAEPSCFTPVISVMFHCCSLQYTFHCIMIHIAQLKSTGLSEYRPWVDHDELVENEDVEREDVNIDDIDEKDPISDSSDSGYKETNSELQLGPHASKGADISEFSDQLTKFLEKMGSWVSTVVIKASNTQYQCDKVLKLSDLHDDPLSVNLQRWRSITIKLITLALSDAVSSMIPEACQEMVQAFNFCNIINNFMPHPVYQQKANTIRLSMLINLIVTTLLTPSTSNCFLVDSNGQIIDHHHLIWLKREQNLLGIVVAIFVLTSSPCFHSFQFSKLQYCGTSECDQNLYFFSLTFIRLANPPAKQINAKIVPTTLLFPPQPQQASVSTSLS
ncbi:hypothetical protein IMY05_C4794000400 [Salix suchowensis]|nr:hypothetical protein IMY05_C4794000400 [Salix suchowensis]